jgi:hypothetical protein
MSGECLEESELSSGVVRLDSPSTPIQCTIYTTPFDALYNPVVGINIMALSFFYQFIKNTPLSPTMKLLKCSLGQIIESSGILYVLPISVNDMPIHLSFHICDIKEFDLLIGHSLERLLKEGHTGKLDICLRKTIRVPLHFAHLIHTKTEPSPEPDPMEEADEASLEHFVESNQEDVTEFFTEEEEENPTESEPLDELEEPSRPTIELKPLPPSLRYAFLHNDPESPVIINNKLTQEETHRMITILEQHRSAFGYSLHDLKGINPALCTQHIPTDPDVLPSREPQRRLNNAMRQVVKKEVLKLLHVVPHSEWVSLVPQSEWVSPVQVVPKKGGMTVVKNERNELIPQRTVTGWHMYIDYRKLNKDTRKDHFHCSFIYEMLERLANHSFFCFLDSGITKSQSILVTRAKPLLHVLMELMLIIECILDYVMLQLNKYQQHIAHKGVQRRMVVAYVRLDVSN